MIVGEQPLGKREREAVELACKALQAQRKNLGQWGACILDKIERKLEFDDRIKRYYGGKNDEQRTEH